MLGVSCYGRMLIRQAYRAGLASVTTGTASGDTINDSKNKVKLITYWMNSITIFDMNNFSQSEPAENYCGTTYAARLLGLSVGTVQSLVEKNELQAWKTQGGHRRISMPSIREYQRKHNMPVSAAEAGRQRLRMLVVDDDPIAREMLGGFTSRSDIPVDCTIMSSGLEALIDIASIQPDVLIADLNMPGVDGFELLRTLRTNPQFSKMSCLAISALTQTEIEARGGLPEGVIFMPKPLSLHWLNGFLAALEATRQSDGQLPR